MPHQGTNGKEMETSLDNLFQTLAEEGPERNTAMSTVQCRVKVDFEPQLRGMRHSMEKRQQPKYG